MTDGWAAWIDQQLTHKGWRQSDAARAFNVDDSMVSKWRRGKQDPDPKSLRRIAEALEVPILTVLVAAGYLSAEEAGAAPAAEVSTDNLSTLELVEELRTRISSHLDQLDPPPPGRNPHPPRRASDVPDTVFSNADVDQTEQSDYSDRVQ